MREAYPCLFRKLLLRKPRVLAVILAVTGFSAEIPAMVAAALMPCGFGNSADPTIISSLAAEFFGRAYYGRNMSVLNMNMVPGSLGSSVAGAIQTASGSYRGCFVIFGLLEFPALLFIFIECEIATMIPLLKDGQIKETLSYIKRIAKTAYPAPPKYIGFANGILDIESGSSVNHG